MLGKKVVVTGGAGFVGVQLVAQLAEIGASVTVMDDFSRGKNRVNHVEYIDSDAGHAGNCERVFKDAYAVFNLAAFVAGVRYNQGNHVEMFYKNMRLLCAPVMAAEKVGVEKFLQVSSVCAYGEGYNSPCREDKCLGEPVGANAGYSMAKRMGELVAKWSNVRHVVIVRPSNVFGPYDYFDARSHVIPALIKKALGDNDTIEVYGTGEEKREFIYSSDVARGMIASLENGNDREAYNVGTGGETCVSMHELVGMIQKPCGTNKPVVFLGGDAGDKERWSDVSKIESLGWKHKTKLETGLAIAVEWYVQNNPSNM